MPLRFTRDTKPMPLEHTKPNRVLNSEAIWLYTTTDH